MRSIEWIWLCRGQKHVRPMQLTLIRSPSNAVFGWLLLALAALIAVTPLAAGVTAPLLKNRGTGFFISSEGHFVTANHVIGGCGTNAVLTPNGFMPADLVAQSKDKDLAVIKTRNKPDAYGRFTADPGQAFRRSLSVTRFLHKGGLGSGSTTTGRFLGKTSARGRRFAIKAKDTIAGGNSGAPVVDYRGGIVGMLVARAQKDARVGIAVDVFTITEFLSQSDIKIETVASGETNPLASGASFVRTYTFPVVCVPPKKKKDSNPE